MDINEGKKVLSDTIQLQKERDEYEAEISSKEKALKKLNMDLEFAEDEYRKLENSAVKKLFLGIMGKREASLQDAQNEIRRLHGEVANIEFTITSARNRIEHIEDELQNREEHVMEGLSILEKTENGDFIKKSFLISKELPVISQKVAEKNKELKKLLERATEIYTYGDIHSDMSGHRYNKRDTTLRNHTLEIKKVVKELITYLDAYNSLVPQEIQIIFREDWMDNEHYWDGQQLAEDSYSRVKKVDDWCFRFSNLWKKMKKQHDEVLTQLRNELLEYM